MTTEDARKLVWKKNWSGPWTLLECFYYGRGYTQVLREKHGVGLDSAIFICEPDKSANYLVESELGVFGAALAKKIEQDTSVVHTWGSAAKEQGDKALSLMKSLEGREITRADYNTLWEILMEYLAVSFPVKRVGDYLSPDTLKELLPTFEKIRVYGEPVYAQAAIFIQKFATQLSGSTRLSPAQILRMTDLEIENYFNSGKLPEASVLSTRVEHSVLVVRNGKHEVLTGSAAAEIESAITNVSAQTEIRGSVAYKGVARGKVRIVFDPRSVTGFSEPTILVTGMTRPEYLHLFREAAGVVTDAGGILSHAAITARELKIPCIIGTEVATKVLRDGDLVEVDANTGVVRIIEKKS